MASAVNIAVAPPPPFTPADVAVWYDATDDTTFSYSSSTFPSQWRDKSVNGWHLTPGTAGWHNRNVTINGLKAVNLNQNGGGLNGPSIDIRSLVAANFTDCMMFGVMASTNQRGTLLTIAAPSSQFVRCESASASFHLWDMPDAGGGRLTSSNVLSGSSPMLWSCYRNGANMAIVVNGTTQASKANATGTISSSSSGPFKVWTGISAGTFVSGPVGELVHVPRYDAALFTSITAYLKAKWGTP